MNNFAISSGGIGEALLRSASALNAAGNTLDESIALITAANTIVQDPDSVGTVMKSLTMFLRAAKTEAEEAGESTDGMANSVSELREELSKLTGGKVDIMEADGQTFRSTYDILKQIASVWKELSDVTQANILELIGGKRNSNVTSALISNFELAEKVVATSANSAGSALAENEKVLESITGHINKLKAAFETLSATVVDSDIMKFVVDIVTWLINITNSLFEIINAVGGLKTILIAGGGVVAFSEAYKLLSILANGEFVKTFFNFINLFTKFSKITSDVGENLASTATNGKSLKSVFDAIKTAAAAAGVTTTSALIGVTAVVGAVTLAVKAYKEANPTFETLQEQADEAQQKLSSLESQLTTTKERLKELQQLANDGSISIVEADELKNLQRENELLEAQIAMQKELARAKNSELIAKAKDDVGGALYGVGVERNQVYSGAMSVEKLIAQYTGLQSTASMYDSAGKTDLAESTRKKATEYLEELQERQEELIEIREALALDADGNADLIYSVDLALDKITVALGDAQTLGAIWDKVWGSDSPVRGAKATADALTEAATAQHQLNEELKKYGSNVDLEKRPVLTYEQVKGNSAFEGISPDADYITLYSQTFGLNEFGRGKADSTGAILVTPILPDGSTLTQDELENYINNLFDDNGNIDLSKDISGIVMGVVDEGDVKASIEKLDQLGIAASAANGAFLGLFDSTDVRDVIAYLEQLGYDMDELTANELAAMFVAVQDIASAADSVSDSFSSLYTTVTALSEKKGLLNDLKDEIADGGISDSTLSSLYEQYNVLGDIITQYRFGLATAQDVYNEYARLYQEDEQKLLESAKWKVVFTENYFEENIRGAKSWVKALGEFYTADFENYKELAVEKEKLDTKLIAALGEKWGDYYSSYASALKAAIADTDLTKSEFYRMGSMVEKYGSYENYIDQSTGGLYSSAALLDKLSAELKNIGLSIKDPTSGSSSSKVDEYIADIDEYREAIERLSQAQLNVESLESKLDLSDDMREQIQLRSQMLDLYKDEMEAQETLNKLRKEGIEAGAEKLRSMGFDVIYDAEKNSFLIKNLEHINELEAKTKGTHSSLQEATNELRKETEEYIEKLEDLNEDNQEGESNWRSLQKSIHDAKTTIVDDLKSIATTSSEALDSIQSVYDTLRSAADEYAGSSGFLTLDTFQSILELGPQYMQYLRDESGRLTITREKIEEVMAAKVQQLALDNAMVYVERLRLALQEDSVEELNELLYATTEATDATWGFLYANVAMLDLSDKQREAALHNIDTMRALADNVASNMSRIYSESSMEDLIQYTMDMIRDKIEEQKDALEEMKDTYKELIDLKKESLDASKDEADHQKDVANKLKEIAKLQARIDILSLDSSREAQAERAALLEELSEKQDELA